MPADPIFRSRGFRALLALIPLAALWWVIAGGVPASWIIGGPAVLAAAWAVGRLGTGAGVRLSMAGLLRFLPFFVWESLRAGVDVALRTLAPRPRVEPGFLRYQTRLCEPAARVFLANCINLLPGTLAAELEADWLTVHTLSTEANNEAELRRLELAVARLFSDDLEEVR
jgi:multicomponent Na+:H+ antiporter subunit E